MPAKNPKQTRRSISMTDEVYSRIRAHCELRGISMSGFVEQLTREHLSAQTAPGDDQRTVSVA